MGWAGGPEEWLIIPVVGVPAVIVSESEVTLVGVWDEGARKSVLRMWNYSHPDAVDAPYDGPVNCDSLLV